METQTDISTEIKTIITQHLGICIPDGEEEKNFEKDLNANALDIVEIWIEVEKKLNISVSDDKIVRIKTIKEMIEIAETAKQKSEEEK